MFPKPLVKGPRGKKKKGGLQGFVWVNLGGTWCESRPKTKVPQTGVVFGFPFLKKGNFK